MEGILVEKKNRQKVCPYVNNKLLNYMGIYRFPRLCQYFKHIFIVSIVRCQMSHGTFDCWPHYLTLFTKSTFQSYQHHLGTKPTVYN